MSLHIGILGTGAFAQSFIPLLKHHPLVRKVTLCDQDPLRLRENSERHGIPSVCPTFDRLCASDVSAIAIFTQHWLHAPQATQALRAGKDVYSAVPTGVTLEEITQLVRTVEETQQIYMIGETSYYYPAPVYCRQRFAQGDFGHIVYGEGEYYHDYSHGLEEVYKRRAASLGLDWRKQGGDPPMFYPTHSTSMIVSVTGAHMTHVSCLGYVDREADTVYNPQVNVHKNSFSNQTALFRMSDGSMARINEFRRVGHPGVERLALFGTRGCFEHNMHGPIWLTADRKMQERLDEWLTCADQPAHAVSGGMEKVHAGGTHRGAAKIHDLARLPKEFVGLPNGHNGSHQFLIDDWVKACVSRRQPPNNVWQAARYAIPGLIAHESSLQGGKLLEVPDLGSGPANA